MTGEPTASGEAQQAEAGVPSPSNPLLGTTLALAILAGCSAPEHTAAAEAAVGTRPNILFCIADDWGWPHAGAYDDAVIQTPAFDRIAAEGVLFRHAYVSSPSCTPSRNAILTGQWHWRLGPGASLWSTLDEKTPTFPLLLEDAGYYVGHWRKAWGPGKLDNWDERRPDGKSYQGLPQFLATRPKGAPFCFWLGASDPHRPYRAGSGAESGMDPARIELFAHFPDSDAVRNDVADYYFEVQRFDRDVAEALAILAEIGELDNTIVIMTGDHGMPFPRGKGNLYDSGVRVPLAVRWPQHVPGGRIVDDFVSTTDLAPTFLRLAGVAVPEAMTGRSLLGLLTATGSGRVDPGRDHVFSGKERHTQAQEAPDLGGTPMRSIRTADFLYIRNFRPDRWPAGTPHFERAAVPGNWLSDCDNGPTKTYLVYHQDRDEAHRRFYELSFGKRPEEELYDLRSDPGQLVNVAYQEGYRADKEMLWRRLRAELEATRDPRVVGGGEAFDAYPYFGGGPKHPSWAGRRP